MGAILPVEISIYDDRSFDFVIKTSPVPFLIKKFAKINKGPQKGTNETVALLPDAQGTEIPEVKFPDLNCYDLEAAKKTVIGTAKNMGVAVETKEEN